MYEILIDIVHDIIENNVPNSNFLIVLKIFDMIVDIIKDLDMKCMILRFVF